MPEPLHVLIVGCGDIAGGYDEAGDDAAIRTHAGAYARDARFRIAACIEPDHARRGQFMAHWRAPDGFADLAACQAAGGTYDVASVCAPTAQHGAVLEGLLDMPLRAVFAEKPLTGDVGQSAAIVDAYEAAGRPLAVNFQRRFDPVINGFRAEVAAGSWGRLQSATAHYAKGLFNCGSHAVDLLRFLIGELRPLDVSGVLHDGQAADPTVSARLETDTGAPVYLIGCDSRMHFPFEMDLVFEKGRVSLEDLGARLRRRGVRPHPLFLHQTTLDNGAWNETEFPRALHNAVAALYDHLAEGRPLASDGASALATERVCSELMLMAKKFSEGDEV